MSAEAGTGGASNYVSGLVALLRLSLTQLIHAFLHLSDPLECVVNSF